MFLERLYPDFYLGEALPLFRPKEHQSHRHCFPPSLEIIQTLDSSSKELSFATTTVLGDRTSALHVHEEKNRNDGLGSARAQQRYVPTFSKYISTTVELKPDNRDSVSKNATCLEAPPHEHTMKPMKHSVKRSWISTVQNETSSIVSYNANSNKTGAKALRVSLLAQVVSMHLHGGPEQAQIFLLHEYNEVKDAVMKLMELIAIQKEQTLRETSQTYGISDDM